MNHRTKRWVSAVRHLFRKGGDEVPSPGVAGFVFHATAHPIEGWQMATARQTSYATPPEPTGYHGTDARLVMAGVRKGATAADIELGVGLVMSHRADRHKFLEGAPEREDLVAGLFFSHAKSNNERMVSVRPGWRIGTETAPCTEWRGRPVLGDPDYVLVHLDTQVPGVVAETALSGRATEFGGDQKVVLGVPWLDEYHELTFAMGLKNWAAARAKLVEILTPAPAPTDSEDEE